MATISASTSVSLSAATASGWVTAAQNVPQPWLNAFGDERGDREEDEEGEIRDGERGPRRLGPERGRRGPARTRTRDLSFLALAHARTARHLGPVGQDRDPLPWRRRCSPLCPALLLLGPSYPLAVDTPSDSSSLATMPVVGSKNFVFSLVHPPRLSIVNSVLGWGKLNSFATDANTGR